MFNYPYVRTREALEALAKNGAPDPYHGHKLRYVNPASGEFAMPTIATFVQLLPAGFAQLPYRSTDGTVFVCVEGAGETRIGDKVLHGSRTTSSSCRAGRRTPITPRQQRYCSASPTGSVQEKLGLWREARGNA